MKKTILILLILIIVVYAFFIEPNMITITNYQIQDNQLSGLKIVFISDWHIKPNQEKRLHRIIELINEQNPDMVLSSGDFVSGHTSKMSMSIENIAGNLKQINAPIYTVLGNHDWWQDGENITKELEKNSINVLANNNIMVKLKNKTIYIAGIEDLTTRKPDLYSALDNTQNPIILLTHSPDVYHNVPDNVNLILAGHLHGGQVRLPFLGALIVPSKYGNKYSNGLIQEQNKKMIVTKGIGNSILNLRINCIPEIVVINYR